MESRGWSSDLRSLRQGVLRPSQVNVTSPLPSAFNEEVRRLLGLTVPDDSLGCLQDIHWPGGAWGYFPTYTLGAMTAAQLFKAACEADADILPCLAKGDFAPLRTWLRANVHAKGSLMTTDQLLVGATGQPLTAEIFRSHLRERYLDR